MNTPDNPDSGVGKPLSELVREFLLGYHDSKVRDDDDLEIAYVSGFKEGERQKLYDLEAQLKERDERIADLEDDVKILQGANDSLSEQVEQLRKEKKEK